MPISDYRRSSLDVRHLEAEEASDLGDASGVVADTQGAVMRRSVAAPAVDELGRGQGEGDAGGGVADAERRARKRLALGREQLQAAISRLGQRSES